MSCCEELNDSETTPLASTPNADAARQRFLSRLFKVGIETFETRPAGTPTPLALKLPGSSADVTATLTGGGGSVNAVTPGSTDERGRYSIPSATASRFWHADSGIGQAADFAVNFDRSIATLGFYGIDIVDFGGQLELLLFNGDDELETLAIDSAPSRAAMRLLSAATLASAAGCGVLRLRGWA